MTEQMEPQKELELPTNMLPLFDVDWTLLEGENKPQYDSYANAFEKVYGIKASINEVVPHGSITTQIIIEVLKLHGISEEEAKAKMQEVRRVREESFLAHANDHISNPMPGVYDLLSTLKGKGVPLGLLTGEDETIAQRTLELAGLSGFFDFGAFGNMAEKRVDLIPIVKQEAKEKLGLDESQVEFVIIGDSPFDIDTAKAGGLKSIAVGAGPYSTKELSVTGAELIVDSLQDQQSILNFLKIA